jgi:hypothetical protein
MYWESEFSELLKFTIHIAFLEYDHFIGQTSCTRRHD